MDILCYFPFGYDNCIMMFLWIICNTQIVVGFFFLGGGVGGWIVFLRMQQFLEVAQNPLLHLTSELLNFITPDQDLNFKLI